MTDEPAADPIPDEHEQDERDRIAMASVPAPFVDTWFLMSWRGHVRIAMAEDVRNAERIAAALIRVVERLKLKDAAEKDELKS